MPASKQEIALPDMRAGGDGAKELGVSKSGGGGVRMQAIADAVYAVSYINCRPLEDHESRYDDGDVGALESIAAVLAVTSAEQDALAAAAERALVEELASPRPRPEFVEDFSRWMHDMFGDEWEGNRRVPVVE